MSARFTSTHIRTQPTRARPTLDVLNESVLDVKVVMHEQYLTSRDVTVDRKVNLRLNRRKEISVHK